MLLYKKIVAHDFRYDPRSSTFRLTKPYPIPLTNSHIRWKAAQRVSKPEVKFLSQTNPRGVCGGKSGICSVPPPSTWFSPVTIIPKIFHTPIVLTYHIRCITLAIDSVVNYVKPFALPPCSTGVTDCRPLA